MYIELIFFFYFQAKMSQKSKKAFKDLAKIKIRSKAEREQAFRVPLRDKPTDPSGRF